MYGRVRGGGVEVVKDGRKSVASDGYGQFLLQKALENIDSSFAFSLSDADKSLWDAR